jgi:hypothetical protein
MLSSGILRIGDAGMSEEGWGALDLHVLLQEMQMAVQGGADGLGLHGV